MKPGIAQMPACCCPDGRSRRLPGGHVNPADFIHYRGAIL